MRTRGNGEELSDHGVLFDARRAQNAVELHEVLRDLHALIAEERSKAFSEGMQLGAAVEHRVAVEAIQQAALTVLGKDRGDGAIQLGALGSDVYKEA